MVFTVKVYLHFVPDNLVRRSYVPRARFVYQI
jgi:hypothetical protein